CTLARSPYFVTRYPKASDISSPPCLLRLLPAGAVAGWDLHPLESAAFPRRTPFAEVPLRVLDDVKSRCCTAIKPTQCWDRSLSLPRRLRMGLIDPLPIAPAPFYE